MDDAELKARAWAGVADFTRLVGRHAPGASLFERDGVVASVVPGVPASILNAAIAEKPRPQSADAIEAIARVFADAHVGKWGVWIDADDTETADRLEQQGLVLDSTPVLMGAELAKIVKAASADHDPATITTTTLADVGRINDLAYGFDEPRIASVLAGFPPGGAGVSAGSPGDPAAATAATAHTQAPSHAYGALADGELACVVIVHDVDDDAFVTFVATLPHARGRGLATNLLRHALGQARKRGRHTTTLQASKSGQNVYKAIGYRPLGEQHLWERRP
jgi:ribosomal protein S18 acetylase RimI-like enzyme